MAMNTRTTLAIMALLVLIGGLVVWRSFAPSGTPGPRSGAVRIADEELIAEVVESASRQLDAGEYGPARRILEEAVLDYGDRTDLLGLLYQAHLGLHEYEEAYDVIVRAIELGDATAEMHDAAAMAADECGKLEEADRQFAMAMSLDPTNPKYPLYRAQVLIKLGRDDEARRYLLETIKIDDQQEFAWGTLAQLALRENEPDLALQYIGNARSINPGRVTWMLLESKSYRRKNRPEQAALMLTALPEAARDQISVIEELAQCYGMLRRPRDAAALWANRADEHPDEWRAACEAAEWYDRADDRRRAMYYAEIAALLAPDELRVTRLMERLAVVPDQDG